MKHNSQDGKIDKHRVFTFFQPFWGIFFILSTVLSTYNMKIAPDMFHQSILPTLFFCLCKNQSSIQNQTLYLLTFYLVFLMSNHSISPKLSPKSYPSYITTLNIELLNSSVATTWNNTQQNLINFRHSNNLFLPIHPRPKWWGQESQ